MRIPAFARRYILSARQWYSGTAERALDQAYDAALKIKKIEDEHFGGKKISLDADYGDAVSAYFQSELKKHLRTAKFRLMEFRASNSIFNPSQSGNYSNKSITRLDPKKTINYSKEYTLEKSEYTLEVEVNGRTAQVLEKLKFIDNVIAKYKPKKYAITTLDDFASKSVEAEQRSEPQSSENDNSLIKKSGFIPRSILRTTNKLKRDLDPDIETEEEALKKFRKSKARTKIAVRFLLLLIIVPLITQQISKNFIFGPLVNYFNNPERIEVSLTGELEEKVLVELNRFKEKIEFERLVGRLPDLDSEKMEQQIKAKANQLVEEYRWMVTDPVKNVLSDALSLAAFGVIVATGKREIAILKSFIDEVVYGLSDSAKAFVIILFTDIFVGFHSPHGWEVIVDGTLRHFGLPENEDFINMFIATFPVMLDTVFKYWIFRYLNQISPSAVATYRNMNE